MLERLKELLNSVNENSTVEDFRILLTEVRKEVDTVQTGLETLSNERAQLVTDKTSLENEVSRLREANGRLFSERLSDFDKISEPEDTPKENDEEKIERLMNELDY